MICPRCQTRWADFPIDITKGKMTREQEQERLTRFNDDDYRLCPDCLNDECIVTDMYLNQ